MDALEDDFNRGPRSFTAPLDWQEPTEGIEPAVPLRSKMWWNNPEDGESITAVSGDNTDAVTDMCGAYVERYLNNGTTSESTRVVCFSGRVAWQLICGFQWRRSHLERSPSSVSHRPGQISLLAILIICSWPRGYGTVSSQLAEHPSNFLVTPSKKQRNDPRRVSIVIWHIYLL